jgi:protein SCO1/2
MNRWLVGVALLLALSSCRRAGEAEAIRTEKVAAPRLPDVEVFDQDGRALRFERDLLRDRVVAVNFVYTTCSTICAPMTAIFAETQRRLAGREVALVSVTLDPRTDTPERLAAFAAQFERREGWSFVTGSPEAIGRLLDGFDARPANRESHPALTMIGDTRTGKWKRIWGIVPAERLVEEIEEFEPPTRVRTEAASAETFLAAGAEGGGAEAAAEEEAARRFFTDTEVVDQHGKRHRFYSDLVKDRIVLLNFAYTSCPTVCSPVTKNLARVQELLGDRVGRDVRMITFTVEPEKDDPAALERFAARFGVKPGWHFLTGKPEELRPLLRKLGNHSPDPAAHSTQLVIGDARTGHWLKALATENPERIVEAVEGINR